MNNNSLSSPEGISLKEYVNDKFTNLEKTIDIRFNSISSSVNTALASADKAISKSDISVEKRLDSVNEFRATLSDQQRNLMPRAEVDILTKTIFDRLDKLENSNFISVGKNKGISTSWGILLGVVGLIGGLIGIFLFLEQ